MSAEIEIKVPDLGADKNVPVIELLAKVGDVLKKDQGLITLESDKATMEVPSSQDGELLSLQVKVGDTVNSGDVIARLRVASSASAAAAPAPVAATPTAPVVTSSAPTASAAPVAASASGKAADFTCQIAVLGSGPGG
ncbi:MAG TPA: biotin/lipoyl-binding protein, partial [Aquimonas sp.]|nr:biotin/lipoyl-binding protein [Aquimonas sp.]